MIRVRGWLALDLYLGECAVSSSFSWAISNVGVGGEILDWTRSWRVWSLQAAVSVCLGSSAVCG